MKVRFITDVELEVVDHYDEELDEPISKTEVFKTGEEVEFDIFGFGERLAGDGTLKADKDVPNIQFPDGSVVFGVSREWFEILEGAEELDEAFEDLTID